MNFATDNVVGASDVVLRALVAANAGTASTYGDDAFSRHAARLLCGVFERDCAVFLVASGTAANALALGALAPPHGAIFCHSDAHIMDSECGAPEMFTAGAKLVGIDGPGGKLTEERLAARLASFPRGVVHQVQPAALSLSQATESGTVYGVDEVAALAHHAHAAGLRVHMDGARFANALATLGCSPAAATWRAGVDVLSFGASKNGALACEAVVFFDPDAAGDFAFRRKRSGHTIAKGRLLGAQMAAYLEDGHWLDLARAANRAAATLSKGLAAIEGIRVVWPTQANEIFVNLPPRVDRALKAAGALYYEWGRRHDDGQRRSYRTGCEPASPIGIPDHWPDDRPDDVFVRLVCSYATEPADINRFLDVAGMAAAG